MMCRCQTRLKLKFDNIQHSVFMFEECHLSQYHQSERKAVEDGRILPLKMNVKSGARRLRRELRKRSLNGMLAIELIDHDFVSE